MTLKPLLLAAALVLAPVAAEAAQACRVPQNLTPAPVEPVPSTEVQRGVVTAYHLLALSWSPEWCRTNGQGSTRQRMQCGEPRGFVLHGLWPNGERPPYPRYCNPVGAIDPATVRGMYCRTPSPELLQHEWQAHGACGWTDPKAYFARAAELYDRIVFPRLEAVPRGALTAGAVRRAFAERNRWLSPDGVFVAVDRRGRLTEVRLCYDLAFQPMRCRGGIGAPDPVPVRLTPSATGRF